LVTIDHAAGQGHGATAQIGAGAPNGERQAVFVAKAHRLTQRFSRRGPHDQPGLNRIHNRGVVRIGVQVGGIGPRVIVTDDGFEFFDKRIGNHGQGPCCVLERISAERDAGLGRKMPVVGGHYLLMITTSSLGPWTPNTRVNSISAVLDGPETIRALVGMPPAQFWAAIISDIELYIVSASSTAT
jgi:hypothetical protein